VDYGQLAENLRCFYDFAGKVVIFVGAGGGQLLDPNAGAKRLIAIDQNAEALAELKAKLAAKRKNDSVEVVAAKFEGVAVSGDVVYFELCLHEMEDPEKALAHARTLAPDIVVFDHLPDSEWAFYTAEDEKVRRSAEALKHFGVRRREVFLAEQRFRDHAELLAKVAVQGPLAIQRAQRFAGTTNIAIPMSYELALL
jgi:SAM-dependent methyltransferase